MNICKYNAAPKFFFSTNFKTPNSKVSLSLTYKHLNEIHSTLIQSIFKKTSTHQQT